MRLLFGDSPYIVFKILALLLLASLGTYWTYDAWVKTTSEVMVEIRETPTFYGEVFINQGKTDRFSEIRKYPVAFVSNVGAVLQVRVLKIHAIRLDPETNAVFHRALIRNRFGEHVLSASEILSNTFYTHNVSLKINRGGLSGTVTGDDPYFIFSLPNQVTTALPKSRGLFILAISFLTIFAFLWGALRVIQKFAWDRKLLHGIHSAGDYLSKTGSTLLDEPHLIRFRLDTILLFSLLGVAFLVLVSFKVSGSSFAMWDQYVPQHDNHGSLVFGQAQSIRSDEWKEVPAALNPAPRPFTPVSLVQPRSWGNLLLGPERGFSYTWFYDWIIFFTGVFLLFMLLTGGRFFLAATGALWAVFSTYSIWWGGTPVVGRACMIMVCAIYLVFGTRKRSILLGAFGLLVFGLEFSIGGLYPAWQVPMAYLIMTVLFGYTLQHFNRGVIFQRKWLKAALLVSGTLLLVIFLGLYLQKMMPVFAKIMATEYPGLRFSTGGLDWIRYFSGYFEWFYDRDHFPTLYGNVCEAGNYYYFFPFVALGIVVAWFKGARPNLLQLAVLSYLLFMSVWTVFGYPDWVAKITLLSMVPSTRAFLGIGIAGILLTVHSLSCTTSSPSAATGLPLSKSAKVLILAFSVLLMGFLVWKLGNLDPYYTRFRLAVSGLFLFLAVIAYVGGRRVWFMVLMLAFVAPNVVVHPVNIGYQSILGKDIVKKVRSIQGEDPHAKWIIFGEAVRGKIIQAGARDIFNCNLYPDLQAMAILDPENRHKKIWNRYSAFIFVQMAANMEPSFVFHQLDVWEMRLNPESSLLKRLGINYLLFTFDPGPNVGPAFERLNENPLNGMFIFRRRESHESAVSTRDETSPFRSTVQSKGNSDH